MAFALGLENHPQKTAQEVIDIVAPFAPWVGSANDTGWFATQGYRRCARHLRAA